MSSMTRPGNPMGQANGGQIGGGQYAAFDPGTAAFPPALEGVVHKIEAYGREKPLNLLMIAAGVGFILGWKLKPW